jgi:hypothetical protein
VFGLMVESHLVEGAQKFTPGKTDQKSLAYGQSITDACLGWDQSLQTLEILSTAVQALRAGCYGPTEVQYGFGSPYFLARLGGTLAAATGCIGRGPA